MATTNQFDANRAKAQHSTGPRTEEGKRKSSQNALRHGLAGQIANNRNPHASAWRQP